MKNDMNFLILDEPTNHLDTASKEWIEAALADFGGTLLVISHDRYFINRFADRVWELEGGRLHDYRGDFEYYKSAKERAAIYAEADRKKSPVKKQEKQPKAKAPRNNERLIAKLEREISVIEKKLSELEASASEFASDYERLMEIEAERESLSAELEEKYGEWESAQS